MASPKNDALVARSCEGSLNYYDNHRSRATAADKGLAARLGGHSYNILNNSEQDEVYFKELRHDDHFLDKNGRHTAHWFGCRRRALPREQKDSLKESLRQPDSHPRDSALAQRRRDMQLANMEHPASFRGFQNRCQELQCVDAPKRVPAESGARSASVTERLQPRVSDRAAWLDRRSQSVSSSLRANQQPAPRYHSTHRVENHDFAVTKKNNHFSGQDKLTRSDAYFTPPKLSSNSNSVKYDIVSNERRVFVY
mmetsp:Transcript_15374/g.35975  ORF Transcript_15374/g.35975 Transcript_15374/m.35975 type:complete len:253 (+) Transcript_15374:88-846(+)